MKRSKEIQGELALLIDEREFYQYLAGKNEQKKQDCLKMAWALSQKEEALFVEWASLLDKQLTDILIASAKSWGKNYDNSDKNTL